MKPYRPWEFCKAIGCTTINSSVCRAGCDVYAFHKYLQEHQQIWEAGSELERLVNLVKSACKIGQINVSQGGYADELTRFVVQKLEDRVNDSNLKPCPFCGGEAAIEEFKDGSGGVVCTVCKFQPLSQASYHRPENKTKAIEWWNRRVKEGQA